MRPLAVCLALAGCARAGPENRIIGGLDDAAISEAAPPDTRITDAAALTFTLSQTPSDGVIAKNSFGCAPGGITRQNSYYRVFALADHGITTTLHVTSVTFGIQSAIAGANGAQPATVRIGSYRGALGQTTLDLTQVQPISSVGLQIQDASATTMTAAIAGDISAGGQLIAELAIPDGRAQGHRFVVGSNAQGERRPGYTRAADCGYAAPTTMQSLADAQRLGTVDLVMTVSGVTDPPP